MRTNSGFKVFGEFGVGNVATNAQALFKTLQGEEKLSSQTLLHIDLDGEGGSAPAKIRTKSCRLDELAGNCKLITREVFGKRI